MARIQVYDDKKILDIDTSDRAPQILCDMDPKFPKSLQFGGVNGEYVYVHLTPRDIKRLREWALQQSINEL